MTAIMVVMAMLAQAQPPARDARPIVATGSGIVTGVVLSDEAQPRPLRRARVTINGPALKPGRTAITGDNGAFNFDRLPAGRYTLAAAKDAYITMNYGASRPGRPGVPVIVAAGETQQVALRLPRGAVVTGVVTDIDGLPAHGITVTALAYRYSGGAGERRFIPAGMTVSPSDDRGTYRVFGLPAGDYVIAARPQVRPSGPPVGEVRTMSRGSPSPRGVALTQVFHPSATDLTRATRLTLAVGEERGGVDIQLQYVPLARVSGSVTVVAGTNPAMITMVRIDGVPSFEPQRYSPADADGRFTFGAGIPPGRYRLVARTAMASPLTTSGSPLMVVSGNGHTASVEIIVDGEDVDGVSLVLQPTLTVTGRIVFEGDRPAPNLASLRAQMPAVLATAGYGTAVPALHVESGGTFVAAGIVPGEYRFVSSAQGVQSPIGAWWLKSVVAGGRELLDGPLDLRQSLEGVIATFSDRATEIGGSVVDTQGTPVPEPYVVAFAADPSAWFLNSRRIAAVRPNAQGRYVIRNLPPGEYRVIAVSDVDNNEWFDSSLLERLLPAGTAVTLAGVEKKTVDLMIK